MKLNIKESFASWKNLDPKQPWLWPVVPRYATMCLMLSAVLAGGYFFLISPEEEILAMSEAKMETLKTEYQGKFQLATNLDAYKKLRLETEVVLDESLRQLPSKSEMESLLNDIHMAALGRGLEFDLFKPNAKENTFEFYAELPITVRIEGTYHDLAEFNSAVARLPRIVTINDIDLNIIPAKAAPKNQVGAPPPQKMLMTATAKTYRYLDDGEMKEQQKLLAASKKKTKTKPGKPEKAGKAGS